MSSLPPPPPPSLPPPPALPPKSSMRRAGSSGVSGSDPTRLCRPVAAAGSTSSASFEKSETYDTSPDSSCGAPPSAGNANGELGALHSCCSELHGRILKAVRLRYSSRLVTRILKAVRLRYSSRHARWLACAKGCPRRHRQQGRRHAPGHALRALTERRRHAARHALVPPTGRCFIHLLCLRASSLHGADASMSFRVGP
eukprot:324403-Chlamydomonas_euryale.AAC.1